MSIPTTESILAGTTKTRVICYVDGFNLFFGIKALKKNRLKWLDVKKMANSLLKPDQQLVTVYFFTSRVKGQPDKNKRQSTYLDALVEQGIEIVEGKYQTGRIDCRYCGNGWPDYREKMTDVNIATYLLRDAFLDRFDTALLISGDSDLVPVVETVKQELGGKQIVVVFPPKRAHGALSAVAQGTHFLSEREIKNSQLPDRVAKKVGGFVLMRPAEWS